MPAKRKKTDRTIARAAAIEAKRVGLQRLVDGKRDRVAKIKESQIIGGALTLALIVAAITTGAATAFLAAFGMGLLSAKFSRDGLRLEDDALVALSELAKAQQGERT